MEEKEASPTSNSTSPNKKTFVLGVVNASEIKRKVDRKRRWDQPPSEEELDGPPLKQSCDGLQEDPIISNRCENNVSHANDLHNNDALDDIPLPPGVDSPSDRLTASPPPSEHIVIKEQIVQMPSDVLNSLEINSSIPISSSFNELNYTEANQRVNVEIEIVKGLPSASDDEPKTSSQIALPNSSSDVDQSKDDNENVRMEGVNCNEDSRSDVPSPQISEGGDSTVDRTSIDISSTDNVDPAVMEVISGFSPSKRPLQDGGDKLFPEEPIKNLVSVEEKLAILNSSTKDSESISVNQVNQLTLERQLPNKDLSQPKIEKLKSLVDYADDSDESSQQSDKITPVDLPVKTPAEVLSTVCENSLDSREEEFHDCVENQATDECDTVSVSNIPIPSNQESDDLINNNPLETDAVICNKPDGSFTSNDELTENKSNNPDESDVSSNPDLTSVSEDTKLIGQEAVCNPDPVSESLNNDISSEEVKEPDTLGICETSNASLDASEKIVSELGTPLLHSESDIITTNSPQTILSNDLQSELPENISELTTCESDLVSSPVTAEQLSDKEMDLKNTETIGVESIPVESICQVKVPQSSESSSQNLDSELVKAEVDNDARSSEPTQESGMIKNESLQLDPPLPKEDTCLPVVTKTIPHSDDFLKMDVEASLEPSLDSSKDDLDESSSTPVNIDDKEAKLSSSEEQVNDQEEALLSEGKESYKSENHSSSVEVSKPVELIAELKEESSQLSIIKQNKSDEPTSDSKMEIKDTTESVSPCEIVSPKLPEESLDGCEKDVNLETRLVSASLGDGEQEKCTSAETCDQNTNKSSLDQLDQTNEDVKGLDTCESHPSTQEAVVDNTTDVPLRENSTPSTSNPAVSLKESDLIENVIEDSKTENNESVIDDSSEPITDRTVVEKTECDESLELDELVKTKLPEDKSKESKQSATAQEQTLLSSNISNLSIPELVPGNFEGIEGTNTSEIKLEINKEENKDLSESTTLNVQTANSETLPVNKTLAKNSAQSPQMPVSENSIQFSVDLNMECESVDTEQSVESVSESSGLVAKDDSCLDLLNSNSVIDVSSDSTCSDRKDKSSLRFNLSNINKKIGESVTKLDDKICSVLSSDDNASSNELLNISKNAIHTSDKMSSNVEIKPVISSSESKIKDDSLCIANAQSDIIIVPDSDSSNSKSEIIPKVKSTAKLSDSVNSISYLSSKLPGQKVTSETHLLSSKGAGCLVSMEVCDSSTELGDTKEEAVKEPDKKEEVDLNKEPITLRIFKDNNALHSESGASSPKRPHLDDSPKQLEFTLKISKDVGSNIPKATMSPKRTESPQRSVDPLCNVSSEVSITPIIYTPPSDKRTAKRTSRQDKCTINDTGKNELSSSGLTKTVFEKTDITVLNISPHMNNIPDVKPDLNNYNSVSIGSVGEKSIIENKEKSLFETPVNISIRGRGRGIRDMTPSTIPKRRGRPPKRPVMDSFALMQSSMVGNPEMFSSFHSPSGASLADSHSSRPVRECRDRTRPIVYRPRKPRGAGRGRGGGRGGVRIPLVPGREALSAREQEELDRIEARNQQIRLEKLAKRAKKVKRSASPSDLSPATPPPPPVPLVELTEEEKAELAARREAEAKARAEAAAAAALEAEKLAKEAAAAKEAEKLAKIVARKERLRELHRMKREKILAKKAAKKIKDEERRKRKAAEKAAEQAAALQSMYEDETRMSAPDGSLRPLYGDESNRNKSGRMEINMNDSKDVSVEQLAEYQWESGELYMIQEQVAEYLGVKSFKRKYPELRRRPVDAEERKYLEETGLVPKSLCDLGITAVSSAEVLDVMFQDFPDKYEEVRKYLREKQMKEISSKQRALSMYSRQSDKAKADLRDQAMECASSWNSHINKERREERKSSMDLQSFVIHYPLSKRSKIKVPTGPPGNYPVSILPGQFCDFYKRYTSNELMYYPLNTVLYGPLKPNERHVLQSDASQSESSSSSSSESSSSSDDSDSESEADEDTKCKVCNSSGSGGVEGGGTSSQSQPLRPEIFLPCTNCKLLSHPACCKITAVMLPHVRKYNWLCKTCKICVKCNSSENQDKMRLCDLCDRGFHIACLDPRKLVPEGNRWHCAICSFCWSCGTKESGGPSNQWLHEFIKDESGEKVYQRSLCAACCANIGREAAAAVAAAAASARGNNVSSTTPSSTSSNVASTSGGTVMPSPGTPSTPVRGYQVIQTKDGSQVRLAVSRTMSPLVMRSPGVVGSRGFTPETLVVRSARGTETVVVRTPCTTPRPRQNIMLSPNNRIDMVSHLSTININGATTNAKK